MTLLREIDILGEDGFHIAETVLSDQSTTFRHTHEFCEMFLVTEGRMTHLINQSEVPLVHGHLCLVMPEDEHCFQKGDCRFASFVNIAFSRELLESVSCLLPHENPTSTYVSRLPAGLNHAMLSKIVFLSRPSTNLFRISKKDMLKGIILDGLVYLQNENAGEMPAPYWLINACEAMQQKENYTQGLQRFVRLSGKSQEHLTRTMKKCYITTPSAFLNSIRLDEAAFLLKTTDQTVLDVLLSCGFNNVSYFNQLFKEQYGVTPSQYRLLNRTVISPS